MRRFSLLLVAVAVGNAEVHLPAIFADHLVLQRDSAVPIWGTASPGEAVTVEFAAQKKKTIADRTGHWLLKLDPLKTNATPADLKINATILHDVLVGEVWLAGGQSNMAFDLNHAHNATETLAQAEDFQLRFFTVKHTTSAEPQIDLEGTWEATTPKTAKSFSAVAYFFARELRQTQKCPIAILHSSWGGTPIETWISLNAFLREPALTKPLQNWEKALEQYRKTQADPALVANYLTALKTWKKDAVPPTPEPSNPDPMGMPSPSRRPQTPGVSFNAMIAPLIPYAIRGALWYQGEANGSAGLEYRELLPRLIQDWRGRWGTEFPFLYVQLPINGRDAQPVAQAGWPWLREAQLLTLKLPRTGMAIALDVGNPNDVHPTDKIDVGHRLALLARRDIYGEKLVASGPIFTDSGIGIVNGEIVLHFKETGSGLTPGQATWLAPGMDPLPVDHLIGFFIAGENRKWVEAETKIEGNSIVVSSPEVPKPVAVRYGWANSPRCNLYNKEGLPASPFRTDTWPK